MRSAPDPRCPPAAASPAPASPIARSDGIPAPLDRRAFVTRLAAGVGTLGLAATAARVAAAQEPAKAAGAAAQEPAKAAAAPDSVPGQSQGQDTPRKGRLQQSVCRWCYSRIPLPELCGIAKAAGVRSIEILSENDWPVVAAHGLACAVANGPGPIHEGWNKLANHDRLIAESERLLPLIAKAGIPNMIVFSGNRGALTDRDGVDGCIQGLRRVVPIAEKLGVTIVMELLNSKVDHADYHADRMAFGAAVVDGVGSKHFKLLYDIYHMQIMEGDVIRTIRDHIARIGHFHTAGVPGRHEFDDSQELNYRGIAQAIADTGFAGWVGHEFIPRRDPARSLREAVEVCTV